MPVKHFIIDPSKNHLSQEDIAAIESRKQEFHRNRQSTQDAINKEAVSIQHTLKHVEGKVVVWVDKESKNYHTFEDGTVIRRERQFNEFNRRITEPVNATVISADIVPTGSEVLISHNALHDVNRIFDYTPLSGIFQATDIRYYSLPEDDCFAWRDEAGELRPMKNFCFALRVYEPYKGIIEGIEPKLIKNVLLITTGVLSNQICHVLPASDYQIIYQGKEGREESLIRIRHSDDEEMEREEVVAIDHDLTEMYNKGELYVGLSPSNAKSKPT